MHSQNQEPYGFRSIRVFVSSTFRDMHEEREELIKRVFPQLRRVCETRGVAWSEVDLRWGVTDEQKADGDVLPICLAEIDRSRPYFIGLLGQRYGWIPKQVPQWLADQVAGPAALGGASVTEIEILYGVLNQPGACSHGFIYTRDPAWVNTRSLEEQAILGEFERADEIATLGRPGAAAAAATRRQRLEDLKRRVLEAGRLTWQYPNPKALGERVLADFTALIDQTYPADAVTDSLTRDADAHRAFATAQTLGFVQRPALVRQLDAVAAGSGLPLVLAGEPGAGASAIASAWLARWRTANPSDVIFEHHVGATADSSEWAAMAVRLDGELARQHGFERERAEAPADVRGRRAMLFAAIAKAGSFNRRTVILVDGADLLTDVDGAPDLTWLPKTVPPAVRVIVTTSGERPVEAAQRRGWTVVTVPSLDEAERRDFIRVFLDRYAKSLDETHVARLVSTGSTGNALFLRTVLDELRQHGDHFTIGQVIEHYLAAETLDGLLELVLERYERDFERDRPGLVRDSMRALWAARRGLAEPEILDCLGDVADGGERVPHAIWSPLILAAEAGLVTQSGRLVFSTEPHRRAVERRYLKSDDDRRTAHAALARTFATYELGPRVVDELPWHQLGAGDVEGLVATISNLQFMDRAYRQEPAALRQLWARAEQAGHRVIDGYRAIVDDPSVNPEMAWAVARLVTDAGYPTEAARLHRHLLDRCRGGTDNTAARRLPTTLVNLGAALMGQGELVAAEPLFREAIELSRVGNDLVVLQAALGDLALCRRDLGDLDGALALFAEEEAICRRTGDTNSLQASVGNRSQLLRQRGDFSGALALMSEQEELCRSIGDSSGVARALAGQGAVLGDLGNPTEALSRFAAYRAMCEELGDLRGVAEASISEINTLRQVGRREEAARKAAEAEALIRRLSDEPLLARILDAQARAAIEDGRWQDGHRLASEAVLAARSSGVPAPLILALGMLGTARRELGDLEGARAAHVEEESVAEGLGDAAGVATARVNLASVDIVGGDLNAALARYAQAEPVLRPLGLHMTLVPLYSNRWQVHVHLGDTPAAIDDLIAGGRSAAAIGALQQSRDLLTKAVEMLHETGRRDDAAPVWVNLAEVCCALGDEAGLQRAIGERALTVLGRGDLATAGTLLDRQEEICRRIGDQVGLAACVGNRAILLRRTGDLAGSLACLDEQRELAKMSGNGQGYLFATANRGEVLGAMGRVDEGLTALDEAHIMAANWGLTPIVEQLDQMMASLRAGRS
jgi:tetratricopeptide (TPR) repeat protein